MGKLANARVDQVQLDCDVNIVNMVSGIMESTDVKNVTVRLTYLWVQYVTYALDNVTVRKEPPALDVINACSPIYGFPNLDADDAMNAYIILLLMWTVLVSRLID
ncbi:hypothetical protein NECAME_06279 [Necator americanus]|uniref:Uncharacterized protein n=1 Tax=Necator americanus TaxID=51031 RepID=W2TU90_NECAM|nr:hypothetical protein NECAME_06279 [Necator americanus]ETN85660.1 hypothetical protein NECAME_06279 [Necator americanus]